jgi:hypothetical protein
VSVLNRTNATLEHTWVAGRCRWCGCSQSWPIAHDPCPCANMRHSHEKKLAKQREKKQAARKVREDAKTAARVAELRMRFPLVPLDIIEEGVAEGLSDVGILYRFGSTAS